MSNDEFDPVKDALRESLARHATEAPRGDMLAERIINTAQQAPQTDRRRPRHGWRTWALPLVAAGAVGAVVTAIVGIENFRTTASHSPSSHLPSLLGSLQPTPTQLPSTRTTPPPSTTTSSVNPGTLTGFKITDLTFVGNNDGWALGSAHCLSGPGRCTAMWRTTDGRHWHSIKGAEFNVPGVKAGCAVKCVGHIRFATDTIGYAFGPSAFFMTTNGGESWTQEKGGAIQLETLDQNVIRVTGTGSGCPGPCVDGIETSAVGSSVWTPTNFQAAAQTIGNVSLARGNGGYAYLLVTRDPAGGSSFETSNLYRSSDRGLTWHRVGEPCPQTAQEIDSVAIAGGDQGRVSALCMRRLAPPHFRVATSTDAGVQFTRQPGAIPLDGAVLLTGDPATVLVAAGNGMARSTDGGATWQRIADVSGEIGWVGFESQQVGRAVSADGRTIWTTRDAGATWRAASIG